MKRFPIRSSLSLAMIAAIGVAGLAHATTQADIATSVGVVTGKPPVVAAPSMPKPPTLEVPKVESPKMVEMPKTAEPPKMPTMPTPPEMPKMPDVQLPSHPTNPDAAAPVAPPAIKSPTPELMDKLHISGKPAGDASPSTKAFMETNSKMHHGMMIDFTGNADADFVKGMIPHHQGAVDMAKVVLQYGKDPEIKKFAEQIIKAQSSEIEFMNQWLAKHPK